MTVFEPDTGPGTRWRHLPWPPLMRPRASLAALDYQRQWIYTWATLLYGLMLLALGTFSWAFGGWEATATRLNASVAALMLLVLLPLAMLGAGRLMVVLLALVMATTSLLVLLDDPTAPHASGGMVAVIVLASLAESPRWTVVTGALQSAAIAGALSLHWNNREVLIAHLGTVLIVTALAFATAWSSHGVLGELGAGIRRNQKLARTLAESRDALESNVVDQTRHLAEQTAELERTRSEVNHSLREQKALARRLDHLTRVDELTGLANRRGLVQSLTHAEGAQQGCWLLLVDIDHFKRVNDTLGHNAGDVVLIEVGRILDITSPDEATVARIGGEEFAVLIPDGVHPGIEIVCRQLLREIRDADWQDVDSRLHELTVSLGGARIGRTGHNATAGMRIADDALYSAKAAGRDRAVLRR